MKGYANDKAKIGFIYFENVLKTIKDFQKNKSRDLLNIL